MEKMCRELIDNMIIEMREGALNQLREENKEYDIQCKKLNDLSKEVHNILKDLKKDKYQVFEDYIDMKDNITSKELTYMFTMGVKHGIKLKQMIDEI